VKRDIYEAITERFIAQLKRGRWQKPWFAVQNIVSRKPYRGINALLLGSADYQSPFWISFRQALDLGGHVKKGEKSTPVIYYKILEKRDEAGNVLVREDGKPVRIPFVQCLRRLADEGAAILFYSTDYDELIGCCDRVLVLYNGAIVRTLEGAAITERDLVASALNLPTAATESAPVAITEIRPSTERFGSQPAEATPSSPRAVNRRKPDWNFFSRSSADCCSQSRCLLRCSRSTYRSIQQASTPELSIRRPTREPYSRSRRWHRPSRFSLPGSTSRSAWSWCSQTAWPRR
jgi:hypothetical protein